MRAGRKRKTNVVRDDGGISREHERQQQIDYEARLAKRASQLEIEGIAPENAHLGLAGFSLGKLYLRFKADKSDPGSISRRQYEAGDRFARICRRHQIIMGLPRGVQAQSLNGVGGKSLWEPPQSEIDEARGEFRACYDALAVFARTNRGAQELVYGVCVDNWPINDLSEKQFGTLRSALNELWKALRDIDKRRGL